MESFYTLQGEGAHSGTPAYFLRLGGCDVGCHWCDVKESWPAEAHPRVAIEEMTVQVEESGAPMVVITGGEPLMYNLDRLTSHLARLGIRRHVETSGAHPLSGQWEWICFSPKKFKAPHPEYYTESHELKVVVYHKSDLDWAEDHARRMHEDARLFLQPEWSREKEMLPLIISYVKQNPRWRISLQTHKYMDIP
jgi:organic radical activating enzyme